MKSNHKKNSIMGFVSFGIPTIVFIVTYPILIRNLGLDGMGVYLLATSLSGAWAVLDFGMFAATLKYVSEDIEQKELIRAADIIQTSIVFYVVIGLVFSVSIILSSEYLVKALSISDELQNDAVISFNIAGARFALFFLNMVFISIFKSLHRFDYSTLILSTLSIITFGGAAIGSSLYNLGVIGVSVVAFVGNVIAILISIIFSVKLLRSEGIYLSHGKPNINSFKRMFSYGFYLAINGIATSALILFQKFLVSIFLGPAAVTIFTVASTIVSKAQAAITAGFEFLVPWVSKETSKSDDVDYKNLKILFVKSTSTAVALLCVGVIFLHFYGEILLKWWLKDDFYIDVYDVLNVLLIGLVGWGLIPVGYHFINGMGKPKVNTFFLLVSVLALYMTLGFLALDGLSLSDFALSQTIAMLGYGVLFLLFNILVVWKRWLK